MDSKLDGKLSKYIIVKNHILEKIMSGEFTPDSQIPSENELAEQFGVSIVTSRKALSDLVNEGFIYRIRGKGSFVQNNIAQKSKKKLRIVSFLVLSDEESDSSTMRLIRGAQSYLSSKGYPLVIECSYDDAQTERKILEKCIENGMEGVLIFSADPEANIDCYENLRKNGISFVMVDRSTSSLPVNYISSYNFDGAFRLAEHLTSLGHEHIIFAATNISIETERKRYEGYKAAISKAGLSTGDYLFIDGATNKLDQLYNMIKAQSATAVMCVNDSCARAVINHLKNMGMKIPGDISVTGFDDVELSKYMSPPLTTVKQAFYEMGSIAAKILLESIENKDSGYCQILLPIEIEARESTGPVNNGPSNK